MSLQDISRRASAALGQSANAPAQQTKLIAVCVVLGAAMIWLTLTLAPMLKSRPPAPELNTPGWKLANKLNLELAAVPAFADTMFNVESEKPLKLKLVGGVRTPDDLQDLQEFVGKMITANPGCELEANGIEVLEP